MQSIIYFAALFVFLEVLKTNKNSYAVKALVLLLDSHRICRSKKFIFDMQAERRSLSKDTHQNFQYLTEVGENYFYNVVRFVIFHLDSSR